MPATGILVVLVGMSSLLDDTGLVTSPWWLPLALGLATLAILLAVRTLRTLARPPG